VDYVVGTGVDLVEAVCRNDLAGIVAKRSGTPYTPENATRVIIKNRSCSQIEGPREVFEKIRAATR